MNPLVQFLIQLLTPNEARAEIIPQTPGSKQMLQQGLQTPGQGGDIIRALHALPQKVNLTDQPGWMEKLAGAGSGLLGLFRPNMGTGYNMYVGGPQAHQQQGLGLDQVLQTLAHESGHGVAQIAGVGGVKQPTGIGAIDMLANVPGKRLAVGPNEWLADALAGIIPKTGASPDTQQQMNQVMQYLRSQQVLPQETQANAAP